MHKDSTNLIGCTYDSQRVFLAFVVRIRRLLGHGKTLAEQDSDMHQEAVAMGSFSGVTVVYDWWNDKDVTKCRNRRPGVLKEVSSVPEDNAINMQFLIGGHILFTRGKYSVEI